MVKICQARGQNDYRGGVCLGNLNGVFIGNKRRFGDRGDNGIRRHVRFLKLPR